MNAINRRQFLNVLGGASALSLIGASRAFATVDTEATTSLFVKGLVMVDLQNPDLVRLGFPKAPGHKATLEIIPVAGTKRTITLKGDGRVDAAGVSMNPKIAVPELVRVKELYGKDATTRVDQCPAVISIAANAIKSITTSEVSQARYTFVRADNGKEIDTFRPRQIAETIKIDLSSAGTLKLDGGKLNIPLQSARELRVQYTPERAASMDSYAEHFNHYFDYVERPAALDFDVVPKKIGAKAAPTPRVGHHFMMMDAYTFCYLLGD
jgi:hypothetical protein